MYEVVNCVYRDVCHAQSHGREKEELRLKFSWALLDARKKLATEKLAESFLSMKDVDNVEDLTDKIFEEGEIEIIML